MLDWHHMVPDREQALFVAPTATILGAVQLGAGVSIWYGAVLRGDVERIVVGTGSNIQDGAVLHGDPGIPTILGEHVTVGHRAIIHSACIEAGTLIGMGAIILNGVTVGTGSLIGAGAVVTKDVPPGSLVLGVPGTVIRSLTVEEQAGQILHAQHYQTLAASHAEYWGSHR